MTYTEPKIEMVLLSVDAVMASLEAENVLNLWDMLVS